MYKLDLMGSVPLYQQIVDQTREAINKGYLVQGDQLPSVREMAKLLVVNTSTVSRAYKEMENAGMIQAVVGRGTFISFDQSRMDFERRKMEEEVEKVFKDAFRMGFSKEDLIEIIDRLKGGEEGGEE